MDADRAERLLRAHRAADALALLDAEPAVVRADPRLRVLRACALRYLWRGEALAEARAALAAAEAVGGDVLALALAEVAAHLPEDAPRLLARARSLAPPDGALAQRLLVLLSAWRSAGQDWRGAEQLLDEAGAIGAGDRNLGYAVARARFYHHQDRPDEAGAWFARTADLARAEGSATLEAEALAGLGAVALAKGRLDEAAERYEAAAGVARATPAGAWAEASALNGLGECARLRGRLDEAERAYRAAIDRLAGMPPARRAISWMNLAFTRLERGDMAGTAEALAQVGDARSAPPIEVGRRIVRAALAATDGDEAAFDEAAAPFVSAWEEQVVEVDVARTARRAATAAERRGAQGWLVRSARLRRLARTQWERLGRGDEARAEERVLRRLADRGAPVLLGPFLVERRIGGGAFGDVWSARHEGGALAAVKLVRQQDGAEMLANELRAVAGLDHPAIVRLFAHGRVDAAAAAMDPAFVVGRPWIATELAPGGTLDPHLGRWPWEKVRRVVLALLDALAHAHANGVLHLDVKPANVILGPDDAPRLADFGLAAAIGTGRATASGTPRYMAPEQFRGAALGPWTDLYALGCVAVALVAGAPPSTADSLAGLAAPSPPQVEPRMPVPPAFAAWVRRILAPDPAERFQRAADAARALVGLGAAGGAVLDPGRRDAGRPEEELPTVVLPAFDDVPLALRAVEDALPVPPVVVPARWRREHPATPEALVEAGIALFPLRRPPLVGREEERDRLWDALRGVHARATPAVAWLDGGPGVGTSALAAWLCERAHEVGAADVVAADHAPDRAGRPLVVVAERERVDAWTARRLPVLVVVAGGDGDPGWVRIPVPPLSPALLRALLAARLPLATATLDRLADHCAGQPKFAVHLLADLVARDRLQVQADGWALRPGEDEELPPTLDRLWEQQRLGRTLRVGR